MKRPVRMPPLPAPKVDIINLIDVLITLIAFFLFTSVFADHQQQLRVQLPAASHTDADRVPARIEIILTKANEIYCDNRRIEAGWLLEHLQSKYRGDEVVQIKADRECEYEWVVDLLDTVRSSGLSRVALAVRQR